EHSLIVRAGNHMKVMPDDAVGDKRLALGVLIDAEGVRAAMHDDLICLARRMITPDTALHARAILLGHVRRADLRRARDPVAAVEPAVGSPLQTVDDVVLPLRAPAGEDNLRWTIRHIVAVLV